MQRLQILTIFALTAFLAGGEIAAQTKHGGYFAGVFELTPVNKQKTVIAGGKAVWVFNGGFGIGGAYFDIINNVESNYYDDTAGAKSMVQLNYGGMTLEYNLNINDKIDLGAEILLGGGGIKLLPKDRTKPFRDFYGNDFLVWVPGVNISYKVASVLRLTFSAGYRLVTDFKPYVGHSAKDFSDYSAAFAIRLGEY